MRSGGGAVVVGERDVAFEDLSPPLNGQLEAALRRGGVERLFPVQAAVWGVLAGGEAEAHDVCVCAPTGGGKTLAYALPTVAALQGRVVRRLRALVVLPTHDLALQVGCVFAPLCAAAGLELAVCSGKGALKAEQDLLVDACSGSCVDVLVATPGRCACQAVTATALDKPARAGSWRTCSPRCVAVRRQGAVRFLTFGRRPPPFAARLHADAPAPAGGG